MSGERGIRVELEKGEATHIVMRNAD